MQFEDLKIGSFFVFKNDLEHEKYPTVYLKFCEKSFQSVYSKDPAAEPSFLAACVQDIPDFLKTVVELKAEFSWTEAFRHML